ncbi:MAG: SPOR domain-containing protein [Pseudomonadota bacterium]
MLRLAVLILLLANGGYYAWSHGHLREWGFAPVQEGEPQRMNQQLRPETLQILRARATNPAPPPPVAEAPPSAAAAECLQAGVFDERQADALRTAAASLPQGSWVLEPTPTPARWMVYMGRFEDQETLDKKRAELRARKVDFDRPGGTWEIGLSLGRFTTEEAAKRELASLGEKGVRTARVIQERPEAPGFTLRLPAVTDALRPQLDALRTVLAGKALRNCG